MLALAQFRQANFLGVAETFCKFLQIEPTNGEVITSFARALAAADGKSAAGEFQKWMAVIPGAKPSVPERSDLFSLPYLLERLAANGNSL
jgi:hypothetical protein